MKSLLLLAVLLPVLPAVAQDTLLVSTTPAPGDSAVALETTVRFSFDTVLDTTGHATGEGPVRVHLVSPADSIRIDSVYYSGDLTQISFDVRQADDTDFIWLIGITLPGQRYECGPYVLNYTTASRRGHHVVSGTAEIWVAVKNRICQPDAPVVALRTAPPGEEGSVVAASRVDWSIGSKFEMTGVRPGTYWPVLLLRNYADSLAIPYYDWNDGDAIPDSVIIRNGDATDVTFDLVFTISATETIERPSGAFAEVYPNPVARTATIAFHLDRPMHLRFEIFSLLGASVGHMRGGFYAAGRHEIRWDASLFPAGVYLIRMSGDGFSASRMLTVVR